MFQGVLQWLSEFAKRLSAISADGWAAISGVLGIATLPITVLLGIATIWLKLWPIVRERRQRNELQKSFGADSYDADQVNASLAHYVRPDCSVIDPAGEEDLRQIISFRKPLFDVFEDYLTKTPLERHVLLLADTGMGKTSFLLNYYAKNRRARASKQKRIAIIPLSRAGAVAKIASIERKNETIIFLDAFDEDIHAIHDHKARLSELMEACADFKRVVISCRTQFFATDDEIPRETGVAIVTPRHVGQGRTYKFYKLYLAPFSERQIRQYLRERYPLWMILKRKRTNRLIKSVFDLAVRPMLLSAIPDLVNQGRDAASVAELYEFLVDAWLQREARWIDAIRLREFSEALAVNIYLNRETRDMERIPAKEAAALLALETSEIETWQLTSRSLVNRDALGNIKFAHRSIMEYLFVRAFFRGEKACLQIEWTDFMKELFFSILSFDADALGRFKTTYGRNELVKTLVFPALTIRPTDGKFTSSAIAAPKQAVEMPTSTQGRSLEDRIQALIKIYEWRVEKRGDTFIDVGCGMTWMALDVQTLGEEFSLYFDDIYDVQESKKKDAKYLPTVNLFIYFFFFCDGAPFIAREILYWTSDSTDPGFEIAVSIGVRPIADGRVTQLSAIALSTIDGKGTRESLYVYKVVGSRVQRSQQVRGVSIRTRSAISIRLEATRRFSWLQKVHEG